jgi:hypothetical protein
MCSIACKLGGYVAVVSNIVKGFADLCPGYVAVE